LKDVPLALSSQGHDADARPHEDHQSFIDRVKAAGANALLGAFTARDGYDQSFRTMDVVRVSSGSVLAVLVVTKNLTNSYGTLHGGATGGYSQCFIMMVCNICMYVCMYVCMYYVCMYV
jgi:acyl-coenzyme A thioesterase PaaI-like protein